MNKKRSNSSRNDAKTVQALEGFESPSDPVDPNIREIVERMVEMRRHRLNQARSLRLGKQKPSGQG